MQSLKWVKVKGYTFCLISCLSWTAIISGQQELDSSAVNGQDMGVSMYKLSVQQVWMSPAEVLTHHLAYKAKVWSRHRWQAMPQAPCQQYCGLIVTQHPHTHKWQCSSYGDLATVTSNSTLIFPALPHCHGDSPSHNLHGDCPSHNLYGDCPSHNLHWTVPVIIYNGDSPSHNLHAEVSFHWFLSFNTSRQFSPFLKHRAACSLPLSKPVSTVVCAVTGCNSTSRHTK